MANWLERARRELPLGAAEAAAKTAERNPTAVTAVQELYEAENSQASIGSNGSAPAAVFQETGTVIPLAAAEERAIRAWLAHIEETDDAIIVHVLNQCRNDAEARDYFVRRASEVPRLDATADDRRRCDRCANLTDRGLCLAARRGEFVASGGYEPIRDLPRRCESYAPGPDDPDRRPGRERWPGLTKKGNSDANT